MKASAVLAGPTRHPKLTSGLYQSISKAAVVLKTGLWGYDFRNIHRLLSSSCLGLPYRILNMNHKKELLRSLWEERSSCRDGCMALRVHMRSSLNIGSLLV